MSKQWQDRAIIAASSKGHFEIGRLIFESRLSQELTLTERQDLTDQHGDTEKQEAVVMVATNVV